MRCIIITSALFALVAACLAAPLPPLAPDAAAGASDHETNSEEQYYYDYDYGVETDTAEQETQEEPELSQRLTAPDVPLPTKYILSMSTGQFVAITKSGRVQANTQIGRAVAQFTVQYRLFNGREHVTLESVKYADRGWFLTVQPNGRIRGDLPLDNNELFQIVSASGPNVALKLRRMREEEPVGSGEQEIDPVSDEPPCYLGFSPVDGRPSCYDSTNHVETHLLFLDTDF